MNNIVAKSMTEKSTSSFITSLTIIEIIIIDDTLHICKLFFAIINWSKRFNKKGEI